MPRKPRHKFKFDEESVNLLLQEIYDDTRNLKAKIVSLFNKWEKLAQEGGEVAAIGDQIVKLIAQEAKNQDQKIMLLKYLKEVVFEKEKSDGSGEKVVSGENRNQILDMIEKYDKKKQ